MPSARSILMLLLGCIFALASFEASAQEPYWPKDSTPEQIFDAIKASNPKDVMFSQSIDHPDTKVNWGRVTMAVAAPPDKVRELIHDYARYKEFLPFFTVSDVIETNAQGAKVHLEAVIVNGTVSLKADVICADKPNEGRTEVLEMTMLEGNLKLLEGRWELTPLEDGKGTLLVFQLLVDSGLIFVGSERASKENMVSARRSLRGIRRLVEVDGDQLPQDKPKDQELIPNAALPIAGGGALSTTESKVFVFSQLFTSYDGQITEGDNFNDFRLGRAELGAGYLYKRYGGFLINVEAIRSAQPQSLLGVDGDSLVMRIKHAYGFANLNFSIINILIRAGMIPDVWIETLERAYPLRGFAPTAAERSGFFDTSDLGVAVITQIFGDLLELRLAFTNGEGRNQIEQNEGKNTEALLIVRPLRFDMLGETTKLGLYFGYRDGSLGASSARNHRIGGGMTLTHPHYGLGLEYVRALGANSRASLEADMLGVWAHGAIIKQWLGLFARYDRFNTDVDLDDSVSQLIAGGLYTDLLPVNDKEEVVRKLRFYLTYTRETFGDQATPLPGIPAAIDSHRVQVILEAVGLGLF